MKILLTITEKKVICWAVIVAVGLATRTLQDTDWQAVVGAKRCDIGSQALALLPNELWIHAGDTIHRTFATNELHHVTFLQPGRVRPPLYGPVFGVVARPGVTGLSRQSVRRRTYGRS